MSPGGKNIQHLNTRNLRIAKDRSQSCYSGKQNRDILSVIEGPGESLIVYELFEAWKVLILNSKWQTKHKIKYRAL